MAERGLRGRVVLATKFDFYAGGAAAAGGAGPAPNPNACGNGRKQAHRGLEGSLAQLRTDYVDLYWLRVRDSVPPAEELLDAASAPEPAFPYPIFAPERNCGAVFGGAAVAGWR